MTESNNQISIYTDGGARGNPGPAAAAFVVINNAGKTLFKKGFFLGNSTNNVAEYQAVIKATEWLVENFQFFKESKIIFFLDSLLVVNQLTGVYKVKNYNLRNLILRVKLLKKETPRNLHYRYISREKNRIADKLVNVILNKNNEKK